jgi:hypothetical protein
MEIKPFECWREAPVGTILETRLSQHTERGPVIGIRCSAVAELGADKEWFLVLDGPAQATPHIRGEYFGRLLSADLGDQPAANVEQRFIVDWDRSERPQGLTVPLGHVCLVKDKDLRRFYAVRARHNNDGLGDPLRWVALDAPQLGAYVVGVGGVEKQYGPVVLRRKEG